MKKHLLKPLLLSSVVFATLGANIVLAEESVANSLTTHSSTLVTEAPISEPTTKVITTEQDTNKAVELPTSESSEVTIEEYNSNVADFKKVKVNDIRQAFTEDGLEHTFYFGRGSCYHCRQFSPALKEFNKIIGGKLEYYDIDSEDLDDSAKEFLFKTVGIPGTPTVLYIKNGKPVSGWVGGEITAQQLHDYLYLGKSPEKPSDTPKGKDGQTGSTDKPVPNVTSTVTTNTDSNTKQNSTTNPKSNLGNTNLPSTTKTSVTEPQSTRKEPTAPVATSINSRKVSSVTTLPKTGDVSSNYLIRVGIAILLVTLFTVLHHFKLKQK